MSNSGKVKCTCGWSWNKSDSSKKDMYVCHECGRDNSNNMENGGWLDNYNDSETSVPEGYVGEGYDTTGRDYSPAWGGQFEDGGLIPMAQNGRATRADSVAVYNNAVAINKHYDNLRKKGFYKTPEKEDLSWLKYSSVPPLEKVLRLENLKKETLKYYRDAFKEDPETHGDWEDFKRTYPNKTKEDYKKGLAKSLKETKSGNKNKYYYKDIFPSQIDPLAPSTLIDTRIAPQYQLEYKVKTRNNTPAGGIITGIYGYDPLAVKPFDLLTDAEKKLRVQKYGTDGVPKSYINASKNKLNKDPKPDKKPNPNKKLNLDPKPKQEVVQPDLPRVEAVNLPPMQQLQSINPPAISDVVREPKSYNVSRKTYNMKGLNDYYTRDEEGVDYERAMLIKSFADTYNKHILERYGPQNEYRTPKSAADAAERLKQLRSEVEMTPNYQMGGSVYPVNYVPQAQDGKLTFLQPTSDKLPQGYRIPYADPSSELAMSIGGENGEPAYLIPSFKYGKPLYNAIEEFKKTGEHLGGPFKTWQEADKWEQEVRHPYVEKGQDIPMPIKTWGEMAMGGSIPGAVGFSYARTQSPAPSNGKYAKKTLPSAQDGITTWKNQKALMRKEKAGKLKELLENPPVFKKKTLDEEVAEKIQQEKYRTIPKDNTVVRGTLDARLHSNSARNKTDKEIADERKAKIEKSIEAQKTPYTKENWRQQLAAETVATGDKFRVSNEPNFFDDYLNPAVMIGSMASNLGQAPLQAEQQDSYMPYVTSIGTPLVVGALAGLGTKSTGQFVNNLVNPLAGTRDVFNNIRPPRNILVDEKYMGNNAMLNALDEVKSTTLPSKTKLNELREAVNDGELWKYSDINPADEIERLKKAAKTEADVAYINALEKQYDKNVSWHDASRNRANPVFLTGQSIEDLVNPAFKNPEGDQWFAMQPYKYTTPKGKNLGYIADEADYIHSTKYRLPGNRWDTEAMLRDMGESANESFNSMYKPFNVNMKDIPMNKNGGVTKDDMGYWNPDNWGSPVEIGSTDITMEGVYEPLLGVSDTGDTKLMKPGKNYKFKGKKVTEYPMANNGLRQEQKGLVNLDNLLNFTNYNTKQPGGWLDKY